MREKPSVCPICGNPVAKIIHGATKNFYYKCINEKCHFCVGSDYTDEELLLQGQKLKSVCLQCGEPLDIACGPHGLYPRCFNCDCDSKPTEVSGIIVPKWANAKSVNAQKELKEVIKNFRKNQDTEYDFESFIATKQANTKKPTKKVNPVEKVNPMETVNSSLEENSQKIVEYLTSRINEGITSLDIAKSTHLSMHMVRKALSFLLKAKKIKMVGSIESDYKKKLITLYQVVESPLEDIENHAKGYISGPDYIKANPELFKKLNHLTFKSYLKQKIIDFVPLYKPNYGLVKAFKIEDMNELADMLMNNELTKKSMKKETSIVEGKEETSAMVHKNSKTIPEKILEYLRFHKKRGYTSGFLSKELNNGVSVRVSVRKLYEEGKIKIVGYELSDKCTNEILSALYQVTESSLGKLRYFKDGQTYTVIGNFASKNNLKASEIREYLSNKRLKKYPVMINERLYLGYAVKDLKRALASFLTNNKSKPKVSRKVSPKVIEQRYTKNVSTDVIKTEAPQQKKKTLLSILSSMFKKKENPELIKF